MSYRAGNLYLKRVAALIQMNVGASEHIFKFNSDEFLIVSLQKEIDKIETLCSELQSAISQYSFSSEGFTYKTTASISIVKGESDVEKIYNWLFISMQEAKERGKGSVVCFSPSNEGLLRRKSEMASISEINTALENNTFQLFKQKVEAFDDAKFSSYYEILIRLERSNGTILSPGEFLPAAEKYNLMGKIDRWVITELCRFLNESTSNQAAFAVNLSGDTLGDESFITFISDIFALASFPLSKVQFEITERQAIKDINTTNKILSVLKNFGCKVALDDFGKGESSLTSLTTMMIDTVKIDGDFVRGITQNAVNEAIVSSIVDIAKVLKVSTVAEFIEDETDKNLLMKKGVDFGQGYHIHKPERLIGTNS